MLASQSQLLWIVNVDLLNFGLNDIHVVWVSGKHVEYSGQHHSSGFTTCNDCQDTVARQPTLMLKSLRTVLNKKVCNITNA